MKLTLPNTFTLIELKDWVRENTPAKIEMTLTQRMWYASLLRQRVFDRPLKFMGVPIEEYELT